MEGGPKSLCRTCLSEEGPFVSIFTPYKTNHKIKSDLELGEMLMYITSLGVIIGDGLPENVCGKCANQIKNFYLFKKQCEQSVYLLHKGSITEIEDVNVNNVVIKSEIEEQTTLPNYQKTENCSLVCVNESEKELRQNKRCKILHLKKICGKKRSKKHNKIYSRKKGKEKKNVKATKVEEKDSICPVCNKVFVEKEKSSYNEHIQTHENSANLFQQLKSSFPPVPVHNNLLSTYICEICKRSFIKVDQFKNHMNIHSKNKRHFCKICSKGFNKESNLEDHIRIHNGEKPFCCTICGRGFSQIGNLKQHTTRHTGIKDHLCNICDKGFATKKELSTHIQKHSGIRPFVCTVCNKGFTTNGSLKKHKRIHSGEKPYECDECKARFSRSSVLTRHKRIHTGERPYVCEYCAKAFAQHNDLIFHLRIHTGEKPFVCDVCGQAFIRNPSLRMHKQKVHKTAII